MALLNLFTLDQWLAVIGIMVAIIGVITAIIKKRNSKAKNKSEGVSVSTTGDNSHAVYSKGDVSIETKRD